MANELDRRGIVYTREYSVSRYSIDFALVNIKIAVECDGRGWHYTPRQRAHDRRRDAFLAGLGWHVFRYGQNAIEQNVSLCVDNLIAKLNILGLDPPTGEQNRVFTRQLKLPGLG